MDIDIVKEVDVDKYAKPITITQREYFMMKQRIDTSSDKISELSDMIDALRDTMDDIYEITNDYTYCSEAMLKIGRLSRGA